MKELKPCPFCGGEVEWCKNNSDLHHATDDCHYITCERCGEFSLNMLDSAEFPKVYYAIADQWNTRTSIPISKIEELIKIYTKRENDKDRPPYEQEAYGGVAYTLQKLINEAKQ